MSRNRNTVGDLPHDTGTDHRQIVEPHNLPGVSEAQGKGSGLPGWVRWLAGVLLPNMFGPVMLSNRPFVIGPDSIELSGENKNRRYLLIQNNSASDFYVSFGVESSANRSIIIKANGGYYEPIRVPTNAIYINAASSGAAGILVEGR